MSKVLDDVLFIQERVWKDWKKFNIYKIRTMRKDADDNIPQEVWEWNKPKADPRIIPWMAWMRKTWIDELPQIINILKWDMAIFWPRPKAIDYIGKKPSQKEREEKYMPWVFWWYWFHDKWKRHATRINKHNQDVYLRLRYMQEKKWDWNMVKFNTYVFVENVKAILKGVNR